MFRSHAGSYRRAVAVVIAGTVTIALSSSCGSSPKGGGGDNQLPPPAQLTEGAALDSYKSKYCTVSFKQDIPVSNIVDTGQYLKANEPYLLWGPNKEFVKVQFGNSDGEVQSSGAPVDLVASSTCDYKSNELAQDYLFVIETPVYDNAEMSGAAACVMPAGYKISGEGYMNFCVNGTCTLTFKELKEKCGIERGFSKYPAHGLFLKD